MKTNQSGAAGSAFAISYTSALEEVTPENLVVFSVAVHTPWKRIAQFDVPKDLPSCPDGGCIVCRLSRSSQHCTWSYFFAFSALGAGFRMGQPVKVTFSYGTSLNFGNRCGQANMYMLQVCGLTII